ncbi:murein hydrolase activator EnvC family protein [Patescibacteria group bacterium]
MQKIYLILISTFVLLTMSVAPTHAGLIDDLKNKISGREVEIEKLEQEINEYQTQLNETSKEKESLNKEVKTIDITRRKLSTNIKVTQNEIYASSLSIEKLELEIGNKKRDIGENVDVIKDTIRNINEIEELSLAELALSSRNISNFWDDVEGYQRFQKGMSDSVKELESLKETLENKKTEIEDERSNLVSYKSKLSDQKSIADNERYKKNTLLKETKNQEAEYEKILAEKKRLREQFEQELNALESELRIAIDPNLLPPVGKGILRWPLDSIYVTQYFGNTKFAKSGAYSGSGHNGIDFRASVGTPIKAALSGTVVETGDTDQYPGCYSYGKWVLVKHNNGLSTMYAHLSLTKASAGQTVVTGDVIGYSGNTGYSTGPHLHFTVYASQGVQIVRLGDIKKITNCANARIPVASYNAYMNPLDYL